MSFCGRHQWRSLIRNAKYTTNGPNRQRAVKQALNSGNVSSVARLHHITRQTLHRWISRWDGSLASLMDRSHRPRSHPSQQTQKEIELVLRVQRHNKRLGLVCLWVHLQKNFGYTRSIPALYKLLRREGVEAPRKRKRCKSMPREPILMPGERFQMDVWTSIQDWLTPGASADLRLVGQRWTPTVGQH